MKETFDIDDVIKDLEGTYNYDEDIEIDGLHASQVIWPRWTSKTIKYGSSIYSSYSAFSRRMQQKRHKKRHKKIQEILDSED